MDTREIRDDVLAALYSLGPLGWATWPGVNGKGYVKGRDEVVWQLEDEGFLSDKSNVGPDGLITAQFSPRGRRKYQQERATSDQDILKQMEEEIHLGNEFLIGVYQKEQSAGRQVRLSLSAKPNDPAHRPRLFAVKLLIADQLLDPSTVIGGHGDIDNAHLTPAGRRHAEALLANQKS